MRKVLWLMLPMISFSFWSCTNESHANWQPMSLLEYGVPITINVPTPDSVKVKKDDLGPIQDITLSGPNDYALQIYMSGANTNDVAKLKSEQLNLVKEQQYFKSVVLEEEAGFIFENQIDSLSSFGFRYVLVKGGKQIVLQNHLSKLYPQNTVTEIYNAIKVDKQ